MTRIPNIDNLSTLCDRLAIENSKCSWFENKKREEHQKENPNNDEIARWDHLSREACELRSAIKNRIDELFAEVITALQYTYLREPRTFSAAAASKFSDLLDQRYSKIGDLAATGELQKALEDVLSSD